MRIRTPADLGALIRDHRTRLGVDLDSIVTSARRKRK